MPDLIDIAKFRTEARAGKPPEGGIVRAQIGAVKAFDDGRRAVRFCFSDGSVDRVGDTIAAAGWQLHSFEKNPVALWSHDSASPPIGRASNLMVEDLRLMGDIEFMSADLYPFADLIYRMVREKYLNAVSVGFIPLEYSWAEEEDGRSSWGIDFEKQELLEISVCPVPANSNALAEARAKGIDTRPLVEWAEKILDGGGKVIIPRAELETLRKAAKEPAMARPNNKTARPRRRADGMNETDPADGGATVATCGRSADEECGMNDPEECSIHRTKDIDGDDDESKRIAAMVRRAVRSELKRARRKADDDDPAVDDSPEHEEHLRMAHFHMKMAGDCYDAGDDHHEEGMKCLRRAIKALDDDATKEEPEDGKPPADDGVTTDPEKAAAQAKVKRLLAAVA